MPGSVDGRGSILADSASILDQLRAALEVGEVTDFAKGLKDDEVFSGDPTSWGPDRMVPANIIRSLLLNVGTIADPQGVRIRGAFIVGKLDLSFATVPYRIEFDRCCFEEKPNFANSSLVELDFSNSKLPGLSISSATVTNDLNLVGIEAAGEVWGVGLSVGSQFLLNGATLSNPDGDALNLDGATVDGRLSLNNLAAAGEVRAIGLHVGNQFTLNRAKFSNPSGDALSLDGATIDGDVFLNGVVATGEVRALGLHVRSQLSMRGATLSNKDGIALSLDNAVIEGAMFLNDLAATGGVRSPGVRSGLLSMTGAKLSTPGGNALDLSGATIAGGVFLTALGARGEVRCVGLRVGGQFSMGIAKLANPEGDALNLDGATIDGGVFLDEVVARGEIRAIRMHSRSQFSLRGATLSNPDGDALTLDGATIDGDASLNGLVATGEVRALGLHAGSQFSLKGATLSKPDGNALSLDGANLDGGAFLDNLAANGEVRAPGMQSAGQFTLTGATLSNPAGNALNLDGATVGTLYLDSLSVSSGTITLSFASVQVLVVGQDRPEEGLPPLASAQGLALGTIHGFLLRNRKSASEWLDTIDKVSDGKRQRMFIAQPWRELARSYDQIGQPEDGRWLRYQAAKRTTKVAPRSSKPIRYAYGGLVGYGYYPAMILPWLVGLWTIVFIVSLTFPSAFTPTLPGAATTTVTISSNQTKEIQTTGATQRPLSYPAFTPAMIALDTAVPAVATGQSAAWRVTESTWIAIVFAVVKGFSWILVALLLSGISGILRKD